MVSDPSLCRFFKSGPVALFSFELFSSSREGRAETKGTDKMIPLPVPTNKRSFVKSKAVILTKENPNFPVPEKLYTLQITKTYLKNTYDINIFKANGRHSRKYR